jgi:hypothetical protein
LASQRICDSNASRTSSNSTSTEAHRLVHGWFTQPLRAGEAAEAGHTTESKGASEYRWQRCESLPHRYIPKSAHWALWAPFGNRSKEQQPLVPAARTAMSQGAPCRSSELVSVRENGGRHAQTQSRNLVTHELVQCPRCKPLHRSSRVSDAIRFHREVKA